MFTTFIAYYEVGLMDKKFFFGLVKKNGVYSSPDNFSEPEYELYLVNDTDCPVMLKRQSYGGFKTHDDTVEVAAPHDTESDTVIEPHGYVLYDELFAESFDGAGQYRAVVVIEGVTKQLEFYTSRGVGFLGSLVPCVNKYGRVIYPRITDL